jgi:uncharacterized protein
MKVPIVLSFAILYCLFAAGQGMGTAGDMALVSERMSASQPRSHQFLQPPKGKRAWAVHPGRLVFGSMLWVYQRALSPQINATCLYHESCSQFSKEAIGQFGFIKGLALSADRITRCQPLAERNLPVYTFHPETGRYSDPPSNYAIRKKHRPGPAAH